MREIAEQQPQLCSVGMRVGEVGRERQCTLEVLHRLVEMASAYLPSARLALPKL